ncbi:MAG TPA: caspase family protein [Kofleriaceae bacterium]|nr:caspase family protein [Kofleriaceae bacterium]
MRAAVAVPLLLLVMSCSGGGGETSRGAAAPAGPAPAAITRVPRIWILAVGVSNYRTPGLALEFANRDATAIDAFFAGDEGGRIPDERRVLLTDDHATRAAVLTALTSLSRRTAPDDMIVLFLAMHGMADPGGDLYYLAHDTDPKELVGTGLPQRDIEYAISRAPARRVVLLADACHAGAAGFAGFRGRRSAALAETNRLVGQLAESKPGTAVLTASSATEASAEGKKWGGGHGVFTHHLLAGLSGDADDDGDGFITIRELFDFTYRHVSKDTGGDQHPELKGRFDNAMPLAALPGARARVASAREVAGGRGVVADPTTPLSARETRAGAAALEAACTGGTDAEACALIGGMMVRGEGVETDPRRGWAILSKTCTGGSARACCAMAVASYDPHEAHEPAEAATCATACDRGSAPACRAMEAMRRAGGPRASNPKAAEHSRRARQLDDKGCRAGDAAACHGLAEMLLDDGDAAATARARKLLVRACDAGLGRSCELGARASGYSGRDAQRLLEKGCEGGIARACASLASVFFEADGRSPDPGRAYESQRRACEQGIAASCRACADGAEEARQPFGAAPCLQRGCDMSDASACMRLGAMYENGEGVAQNATMAIGMYTRACARGNRTGCTRRDALQNAGSQP